jgi:phenylacetate-coenzyme A ligase PaaK-like adenylate-forming protein
MLSWEKISQMSPDEIKEMQNKKLRDFIKYKVYPYSPFYRKLFDENKISPDDIKTTDDLIKIPFTTKADLAPTEEEPDKPRQFILQPDLEKIKKYEKKGNLLKLLIQKILKGEEYVKNKLEWEYYPIHIHFTTGRTALPTPFFYTARDLEILKECGRRIFSLAPVPKDHIGVNVFPYAPHLAFWQTFFGAIGMNMLCLHTGGGKIMGTERIIMAIERFRANGLMGIPGYLYYLLREAAKQKRDFSSVTHIATGGERIPQELKLKLRDLLVEMGSKRERIHVGATYGFTEAKTAWGECQKNNPEDEKCYGYHTYPDLEFLECINPKTGERVKEGEEGEIVYTALDWRGTVVLRYRTGDVATQGIFYHPCPNCKRTVPRVSPDIKRSSEYKEFNLTKIKGTLVDMNAFFPILMGHPDILEWQLEIRKKDDDPFGLDEMWLYIAAKEGVNQENLKKEIEKKIITETEIAPNRIIFLSVQEILNRLGMETQLKELRIIDNRPKK